MIIRLLFESDLEFCYNQIKCRSITTVRSQCSMPAAENNNSHYYEVSTRQDDILTIVILVLPSGSEIR